MSDKGSKGDKGNREMVESLVSFPTIYWRVERWGKGIGKYMPFGGFDNRMGHYTGVDGLRLKMSEMGWYLPEYKIEVVDVYGGASDEECKQVEARALAVSHPDYSLIVSNWALRSFLHNFSLANSVRGEI